MHRPTLWGAGRRPSLRPVRLGHGRVRKATHGSRAPEAARPWEGTGKHQLCAGSGLGPWDRAGTELQAVGNVGTLGSHPRTRQERETAARKRAVTPRPNRDLPATPSSLRLVCGRQDRGEAEDGPSLGQAPRPRAAPHGKRRGAGGRGTRLTRLPALRLVSVSPERREAGRTGTLTPTAPGARPPQGQTPSHTRVPVTPRPARLPREGALAHPASRGH